MRRENCTHFSGTTVHPFGRKILTLPLAEMKPQRSPYFIFLKKAVGIRKLEAVRKKGEIGIQGCWIDAGQIMNIGNARELSILKYLRNLCQRCAPMVARWWFQRLFIFSKLGK